jgi:hypothetical protein
MAFVTAAWHPGDIHLSLHGVELALGAAELTSLPALGDDVDRAVAGQGLLKALVHGRPPVEPWARFAGTRAPVTRAKTPRVAGQPLRMCRAFDAP